MKTSLPAALLCLALLAACDHNNAPQPPQPPQIAVTQLVATDTQTGTGAQALANHTVTVHYTGWLVDSNAPLMHGKQFDSSRTETGGEPFRFYIGAHQVIPGWDQGIIGMKVGGHRTLLIPSELAYGQRGAGRGVIPPNAALIFDIELLAVN